MPHRTHIEAAHRMVRLFVEMVEAAQTPAEVRELRESITATLPGHFAQEEAPGGFFEALSGMSEHGRQLVEQLSEDHRRLISELGDLVELAHDGVDDQTLLDRLREFAHHLREHERREHEAGTSGSLLG